MRTSIGQLQGAVSALLARTTRAAATVQVLQHPLVNYSMIEREMGRGSEGERERERERERCDFRRMQRMAMHAPLPYEPRQSCRLSLPSICHYPRHHRRHQLSLLGLFRSPQTASLTPSRINMINFLLPNIR